MSVPIWTAEINDRANFDQFLLGHAFTNRDAATKWADEEIAKIEQAKGNDVMDLHSVFTLWQLD